MLVNVCMRDIPVCLQAYVLYDDDGDDDNDDDDSAVIRHMESWIFDPIDEY